MGVSLSDSSITSATPGVLVKGTVDPISSAGTLVVWAGQSPGQPSEAIDTSYIVNGDAAYWSYFQLFNTGQILFRLNATSGTADNVAGPQLTEDAEENIYIVIFYGSLSAAWEFAELDASDETEPYVFSAASVTAAGPTNDAALRSAVNADSTVIAMLVDGNHPNIDIANLEIADPPTAPTAPTVTSTGTESVSVTLPADPTSDSPITFRDMRYKATSEDDTLWALRLAVESPFSISQLDPNTEYEVQWRANMGAQVTGIAVTAGGSGYTSAPTVAISGGDGLDATATATVSGGAVTAITVTNGGRQFKSAPTVTITGGGGSGATATAEVFLVQRGAWSDSGTATTDSADLMPTIQAIGDIILNHGGTLNFTLPDPVGGDLPVTVTLTGMAPWMSFSPTTRVLSGIAPNAQSSTELTYTATDTDGDMATRTFSVNVLLGLADFNATNLQTEALALVQALREGTNSYVWSVDPHPQGNRGSLLDGEMTVDGTDIPLNAIRFRSGSDLGNTRISIEARGISGFSENLRNYFTTTGGGGEDLTLHCQSSTLSFSFGVTTHNTRHGTDWIRWDLETAEQAVLASIANGERFIFALTRPSAGDPPSISIDTSAFTAEPNAVINITGVVADTEDDNGSLAVTATTTLGTITAPVNTNGTWACALTAPAGTASVQNMEVTFTVTDSDSHQTTATRTWMVRAIEVPNVPTALHLVSNDASSITATWGAPMGGDPPTSYDIQRRNTASPDPTFQTTFGVTSPYVIGGLNGGFQYEVQVRGVNIAGNGAWSASVIERVQYPTLTLQSISDIDLTFGESLNFQIPAARGGFGLRTRTLTGLASWMSFDSDGTERRLTGTPPNADSTTTLTYTVTDESVPVQTATRTFDVTVTAITVPEAPAAPAVAADGSTAITVTLSADPTSDGTITQRDIRWKVASAGDDTFTEVLNVTSPVTVSNLTANTEYAVQWRAVNAAGDGAWSPSGTATTENIVAPGVPRNPSVTSTSGSITLSWDAPNTGGTPDSYTVQYRLNGSTLWVDEATGITGTSRDITGLVPDTRYRIRVRAVNAVGESNWVTIFGDTNSFHTTYAVTITSPTLDQQIDSEATVNLRATENFPGAIDTTQWSIIPHQGTLANGDSFTTATWTAPDVSEDTVFEISAFASATNGVPANDIAMARVTVEVTAAPPPEAPGAPNAPTVTTGTADGSIDVSWTDSTEGGAATAYDIQVRPTGNTFWEPAGEYPSSPATVTSSIREGDTNASGLTSGTEYQVQVRAKNEGGTSDWSGTGTGTTGGTFPGVPPGTINNAPTLARVAPRTYSTVQATWLAPTIGDTPFEYQLWWDEFDNYRGENHVTVSTLTHTVMNLEPSTLYYFRVRATNEHGEGGFSPNATITTANPPAAPAVPTSVSASAVDHDTIEVEWTAPAGSIVDSYDVQYRKTTDTVWTEVNDIAASPYQIDGLDSNTAYQVQVRAVNIGGESDWAPTIAAMATTDGPPPQPSSAPTVTAASHTSIEASWTDVARATTYDLRWKLTSADDSTFTEVIGVTSPHTISGLTAETSYDVQIRGVNAVGDGTWSNSGTVETDEAPLATAPDPPTSVMASGVDIDSISVSWTSPAGGAMVESYDLRHRQQGTTNWTEITGITATSRQVNGLDANTMYQVQVRSVNMAGESAWTPTVPATATTAATADETAVPGAPQRLQADSRQAGVILTWIEPTNAGTGGAITGYNIWRHDGNSWMEIEGDTGNTDVTYTDTATLVNNARYEYVVRAINPSGNGAWSQVVAVRVNPDVPTAPLRFRADNQSAGTVMVWEAPEEDGGGAITGYVIYRWTTGLSDWMELVTVAETARTYTDATSLSPGDIYWYYIRAANANGNGDASEPARVEINPDVPSAPRRLQADAQSTGVVMNWLAPVDEGTGGTITGYNIWRHDGTAWMEIVPDTSSTNLTYTDTAMLTTGARYEYAIRAINPSGQGEWSQVVAVIINPNVPSAPQFFAVYDDAAGVHLSWQAPLDDGGATIDGYRIYHWTASSGLAVWTLIDSTMGAGTTYTDTRTLTDGWHWYYIRAYNANGNGEPAGPLQVNTNPHLPGPPQSLTVTEVATGAQLSWQAPSSDGGSPITGYMIWRSSDGETFTDVTTTMAVLTHIDTTMLAAGIYWYRLAAVNANGHGDLAVAQYDNQTTDPVAGVFLGPPANLRVQAGNASALLTWDDPVNVSITSYEYRIGDTGTWQTVPNSGAGTTEAVIESLTNDVEVTIYLRAEAGALDGPASSVTVTPRSFLPNLSLATAMAEMLPALSVFLDGEVKWAGGLVAEVERYSANMYGGPETAVMNVAGPKAGLEALLQSLRRPVNIQSAEAGLVWWGYAHRIEVWDGGLMTTATLDGFRTTVAVEYLRDGRDLGLRSKLYQEQPLTDQYGRIEVIAAQQEDAPTDQELSSLLDPYLRIGQGVEVSRTQATGARIYAKGWSQTLDWQHAPRYAHPARIEKRRQDFHSPQHAYTLMSDVTQTREIALWLPLPDVDGYNAAISSIRLWLVGPNQSSSIDRWEAALADTLNAGDYPPADDWVEVSLSKAPRNTGSQNDFRPASNPAFAEIDFAAIPHEIPAGSAGVYIILRAGDIEGFEGAQFMRAEPRVAQSFFRRDTQGSGTWNEISGQDRTLEFSAKSQPAYDVFLLARGQGYLRYLLQHHDILDSGLAPDVPDAEIYFPIYLEGVDRISQLLREMRQHDDLALSISPGRMARFYMQGEREYYMGKDGTWLSKVSRGSLEMVGQKVIAGGEEAIIQTAAFTPRAGLWDLSYKAISSATELARTGAPRLARQGP